MKLFCRHKWKEKERHNIVRHYTYYNYSEGGYVLIILECKKCGKLKKVNIP
jgi:hypothetical protein